MSDSAEKLLGFEAILHPLKKYCGPLIVFLQSLRVLTTGLWILFLIPRAYDLSFPEGALVARAWDVACGENPYHDWREWPHSFSPYGPLTYYPAGIVGRILGLGTQPKRLYTVGRIESVMALAGVVLVLWGIASRLKLSTVWRFLSVAAFLAWQRPLTFATSYRPDAPQIFFSLLALWIALGGRATPRRIASSLLALSISMWFKPASWGMAATLAFWIASTSGTKRMALAMSLFGILNLGAALILNHSWHGRLFLNMIGSLNNGWEPINVWLFFKYLGFIPRILFLIGIIHWGATLFHRERGNEERIFALGGLLVFAVSTLENLKMGADVNYFFECYALASVSAVYWASGAWEGISRLHPNHRAAAIGLVLIPLALGDALIGLSGIRRDLRNLRANWRPLPVAEFMTRVEGPVFVEQPFLALEKPAPPTLMDCAQFSILSSRGKLKEDQVIRMLAREEFRAIVVAANHVALSEPSWYSPKIKATLLAHYQISETLSGLTVFRPRGSPAAQ